MSAQLVGAQARELRRVRVSFDHLTAGALDPGSYALERLSVPAVRATVVAVEPAAGDAVDLVTSTELSPGASYRVRALGSEAAFAAYMPPRPRRRRLDLYQLLPALNRREDDTGDLRRILLCLQEVTDLLLHDSDRFTDILDPDLAAEGCLDLMLVDLGNPFPFDLSLTDKRRLLGVLVAIYREKGTAAGIRNAIRFFLGLEVELAPYSGEGLILGKSLLGVDWVLGAAGAYATRAFDVLVARKLTAEERHRVSALVDYMKPAHTHFRIVEPAPPEVIDHLELGRSELGATWLLH